MVFPRMEFFPGLRFLQKPLFYVTALWSFTLPRTRLFDRLCTTAARTSSPTAAGCTSTRATGTGTLRSSSGAYSERRRLESRQKPSNTVGLLLRANKVNKSEI